MVKKRFIFFFLLLGVVLVGGCTSKSQGEMVPSVDVTVFKSMNCGCCGIYSQYMKKEGFTVEVVNTETIDAIKMREGVPSTMQSCHTTVVGDYFVEGHVPSEAVVKLLTEKPDIAGIAMPGMPSGSPGMPGGKHGEFVVHAIHHDGSVTEFMRI